MKRFVFQCVAVMLLATPLLAADIVFPPWWPPDGSLPPGGTWQGWEFMTDDPMPMPDFGENPYGFSPAEVNPIGDWIPLLETYYAPEIDHLFGEGVWPLSGDIFIPINNDPKPNEQKLIWVQLTWMPQGTGQAPMPPIVEEIEWGGTAQVVSELFFGPWTHTTYEIILPFNPPHEIIHIWGDIYVDEVVIDTLCTPEPATMGLLAVGGVLALIRRKR